MGRDEPTAFYWIYLVLVGVFLFLCKDKHGLTLIISTIFATFAR